MKIYFKISENGITSETPCPFRTLGGDSVFRMKVGSLGCKRCENFIFINNDKKYVICKPEDN